MRVVPVAINLSLVLYCSTVTSQSEPVHANGLGHICSDPLLAEVYGLFTPYLMHVGTPGDKEMSPGSHEGLLCRAGDCMQNI